MGNLFHRLFEKSEVEYYMVVVSHWVIKWLHQCTDFVNGFIDNVMRRVDSDSEIYLFRQKYRIV